MELTSRRDFVRRTCLFTLLGKTHPVRYTLHRRFLRTARAAGYKVIGIVEPGYPKSYLEGTGVQDVPQTGDGIGSAYRQGLRLALEQRECAAYAEPEKVSYVRAIVKTVQPILQKNVELAVPRRITMRSYPPVQQQTEKIGNEFFRQLTGCNVDVFFGPESIASGKAADIFLSYESAKFPGKEDSHDAHIVPIMECVISKLKVLSVPVRYEHPREQILIERGMDAMVRRYKRLYAHTQCLLERYNQLKARDRDGISLPTQSVWQAQ